VEYLEGRTLLSQFWVSNLNDSGEHSLRQAIIDSNKTTGPNQIDFAAGLRGTITLTGGRLPIANNDVTIIGPGADVLSVSGNNASRVFEVDAVQVAFSGLTITGGGIGPFDELGSGISNTGTLTLTGCTISGNTGFSGGGIINGGILNISGCEITDNTSGVAGGGIENGGSLTIANSIISGNSSGGGSGGGNGQGGGIFNSGTLTVTNSVFSFNYLTSVDALAYHYGGGIDNNGGTLTVADSTFIDNSAGAGGGILNAGTLTVTNSTFNGNTPTGSIGGGGGIENGGSLTIVNSAFSENTANNTVGGGLFNLGGMMTIEASTISGNSAPSGGGIYNDLGGTLTIEASTISGNSAAHGGGIDNAFSPGFGLGMLTIADSTINNNRAGTGAGISNDNGTLSIIKSTINGNSADGPGGGVLNESGAMSINSCTIVGNSAGYFGGGGIKNESDRGTTTLLMSILAGNSAPAGQGQDGKGRFSSLGYNLIGNTEGGSGWVDTDLLNVNPMLGPLQDNGGPTLTMALLPGSPAIDAGSNVLISPGLRYDQRGTGFLRIVNGMVDIGAYEFLPAANDVVAVGWGTQTASLQTAADGQRLLPAGRTTDLPWLGINQLRLTLSQSQSLTPADVTVNRAIGVRYGPVTVSGSGTSYTITLARPINAADRLTITIVNPGISMFNRRLDVLPDDVNDDGVVSASDVVLIRNAILKTGDPLMIGWCDLDGNGAVDMTDFSLARKRLGTRLH
jgi:hypothetical protein